MDRLLENELLFLVLNFLMTSRTASGLVTVLEDELSSSGESYDV